MGQKGVEEMSKAKWKNPNYYHEWYERNKERHLANCKAYNMTYEPKNYKKMWEELNKRIKDRCNDYEGMCGRFAGGANKEDYEDSYNFHRYLFQMAEDAELLRIMGEMEGSKG